MESSPIVDSKGGRGPTMRRHQEREGERERGGHHGASACISLGEKRVLVRLCIVRVSPAILAHNAICTFLLSLHHYLPFYVSPSSRSSFSLSFSFPSPLSVPSTTTTTKKKKKKKTFHPCLLELALQGLREIHGGEYPWTDETDEEEEGRGILKVRGVH